MQTILLVIENRLGGTQWATIGRWAQAIYMPTESYSHLHSKGFISN